MGLPKKNGQQYPPFDYEQLVYNTLQNHKHVWIKKATGLGITEFMLRYMAWLCLRDKTLEGSQMSIVTGPRIDLAIGLIDRLKRFFYRQRTCHFWIQRDRYRVKWSTRRSISFSSSWFDPQFTKLITSLRTAVADDEWSLDKDATSHDDLFDSFRLSLQFWHWMSSDKSRSEYINYTFDPLHTYNAYLRYCCSWINHICLQDALSPGLVEPAPTQVHLF